MEHLINEVKHVKALILRIFIGAKPDLDQVFKHFFGPESSIHNFLKKEVNEFEDHVTFLRFIRTFLLLDFNDISSTILLKGMQSNETFSDLIKTYALLCKSHEEIWKKTYKIQG